MRSRIRWREQSLRCKERRKREACIYLPITKMGKKTPLGMGRATEMATKIYWTTNIHTFLKLTISMYSYAEGVLTLTMMKRMRETQMFGLPHCLIS